MAIKFRLMLMHFRLTVAQAIDWLLLGVVDGCNGDCGSSRNRGCDCVLNYRPKSKTTTTATTTTDTSLDAYFDELHRNQVLEEMAWSQASVDRFRNSNGLAKDVMVDKRIRRIDYVARSGHKFVWRYRVSEISGLYVQLEQFADNLGHLFNWDDVFDVQQMVAHMELAMEAGDVRSR